MCWEQLPQKRDEQGQSWAIRNQETHTGNRVRAMVSIQQDLCVFRCLRLGSG